MALPQELLLSDLLKLRVRCDQGLEHGAGLVGWMHPPVHRLLGWASKPSAFGGRRLVWRLNQLRGLSELEAMVDGEPAETDQSILDGLPTLFEAALTGAEGTVLGSVVDAAVELRTGRILHYLVARSDPRLPGSSRWRLTPERIVDQQPGRVATALVGLDDLPLARSSVRQQLLRRSRRWRDQVSEETSRLRGQFQQVGDRFEERLEGWLEEPPWQDAGEDPADSRRWDEPEFPEPEDRRSRRPRDLDPLDDWEETDWPEPDPPEARPDARPRQRQDPEPDPWV
ncbi:RNA methyltransferase [Synechococcus sp. CS-1324]|uniref:RNA methyltransferase n=1 Tax=Synechococcus sp. CS-1324 TaxID=2847980 RepID=UPI000DB29977|nr:RNA methyltransferase [Synechococcus sp. CS-1324]MCT0231169.1 RNA methyltransferase [Synechococcus sp. CS-1324]PZV05122.1 MAG: RNA methyltransferase [Cyanobium sp.]